MRAIRRRARWIILVFAGVITQLALALAAEVSCGSGSASGERNGGTAAEWAGLCSKLQLLGRTLDGDAAARVEASGSREASQLLGLARQLNETAQQLQRGGDLASADDRANEALRTLGRALRAVPAPQEQADRWRAKYEEVRARVAGFRKAYARIVAENSRTRGGVLDESEVDALTLRAERLGRDGQYREGAALMERAAGMIETALTRLQDRETLVHELKFDSAEQEFAYESQRNLSYELLLELAVAEGRLDSVAPDARAAALQHNRVARERAEAVLRAGEVRAGIEMLETATAALVRVLRTAGLALP